MPKVLLVDGKRIIDFNKHTITNNPNLANLIIKMDDIYSNSEMLSLANIINNTPNDTVEDYVVKFVFKERNYKIESIAHRHVPLMVPEKRNIQIKNKFHQVTVLDSLNQPKLIESKTDLILQGNESTGYFIYITQTDWEIFIIDAIKLYWEKQIVVAQRITGKELIEDDSLYAQLIEENESDEFIEFDISSTSFGKKLKERIQ